MEKNKRMLEILKSFDNSKENFKTSTSNINENKINEEKERLKKLISKETNKDFKNENYYVAGSFQTGGRGDTVNTFLDANGGYISQKPQAKNEPNSLKQDEALEIAIKRVLKSGAPINGISFYDEINWNLTNLGFPSVNPVDIKEAVSKMLA